jgi:putative ABC transport system substrate-binding protein
MSKIFIHLAIGSLLFALCTPAAAQQPKKIPRIGFLITSSPAAIAPRMDAFRQGLRELGYTEEKNVAIEYRYGEGKLDRLPSFGVELVRLKVDVIVAGGATSIRAAKKATETIPIVMTNVSDPVELGFVASLARPGGNITGLTTIAPDLGGKRLELLKEAVPNLSRLAVLGNPDSQSYSAQMKDIEVAARALGLQLQPVELRGANDLENAFSAMTKGRSDAFLGLQNPTLSFLRGRIAERAVKGRLPAVYADSDYVQAGGLMSYGPNYVALYRRAATYVDKILKGAKPADLPVEQPTKFELVINLKTAKQIGLTIPPNVLAKADRVIK